MSTNHPLTSSHTSLMKKYPDANYWACRAPKKTSTIRQMKSLTRPSQLLLLPNQHMQKYHPMGGEHWSTNKTSYPWRTHQCNHCEAAPTTTANSSTGICNEYPDHGIRWTQQYTMQQTRWPWRWAWTNNNNQCSITSHAPSFYIQPNSVPLNWPAFIRVKYQCICPFYHQPLANHTLAKPTCI